MFIFVSMNESPYHISGFERRQLKKERSLLHGIIKMYWFYHDIDVLYGSPKSKSDAIIELKELKTKLRALDLLLEQVKED